MYFAILGRHPQLSLAELTLIETTSLRRQGEYVFFESDLEESVLLSQLAKLWWIVKWWICIKTAVPKTDEKEATIEQFLQDITLVWVNDQKLGMEIKKIYGVRRFKLVDLTSSDLEVKKEGKELIALSGWQIGLVLWRQDIEHFERIDFGKPAHGMEVGMMPSKLAQILVNIGIATLHAQWRTTACTIYDPFCGFGTTGFVANRVGHNFVGSDISITWARENAKWRKEHGSVSPTPHDDDTHDRFQELLFTVFKHDVTEVFAHPVVQKVDVIVTEGWLGPVISKKTREPELLVHAEKINALYTTFLTNIHAVIPQVPLVITLPSYTRLPDAIFPEVISHAVALWYAVDDLGIYSRKGQEVCRHIVVLSKKS